MLHVKLANTGTQAVNSPPNIQAWGASHPQNGATTHCSVDMRQHMVGSPVPSSDGYTP
jgi:hypothetical protein